MPQIMLAGIDDLIPVVIILTVVIARIMKAVKQGKPLVPPPPATNRPRPRTPLEPDAVQPAEELREFLAALSGAPQQRTEPPPPPPVQIQPPPTPAARPVSTPPRAHARKWKRPKQGHHAAAAAVPAPPKPTKPAPFWNQPAPKPRPIIVEACELSPMRQELNKHLEDTRSLRGAWILREVLGPPVALRR
ncbi:MAG: hypothetical protein ISS31_11030 [Kiritimatiellae bacterium]|nr:hypothetical protein [Kiritimatiellia bacterium]